MIKKIGNYILKEKIGAGCFGEVYSATKYNSDELFAIKMLNKAKMSTRVRSYLDREIEILQKFNNDHVISLKDVIASEHNYYLMFDYCNGGDLLAYRNRKGGRVEEISARKILRQVVEGLSCVYALGGIHRDIKLSNILLHYPTQESQVKDEPLIKVCDFGFARFIEGDSEVPIEMSIVGTPLNMSPEMIQRKPYTIKSDIWSLGTITYELLSGWPAFVGKSREHLDKLIEAGIYNIPKSLGLSMEALDFISSCIQYDPKDRLDWKELTSHPFIKDDTVTPFQFEKFKEKNPKACEDKKNFVLSSKVHYEFTSLYPPKKPLVEEKPESYAVREQDNIGDSEFELLEEPIEKNNDEYVVL